MSQSFETDLIWIDGELVPWKDAKVHVMTKALHYGTGAFEGIRAYWNEPQLYIFRLTKHIQRLINSEKIYGFNSPLSLEELRSAVIETVKANSIRSDVYIRPLVITGYGPVGLDIRNLKASTIIIIVRMGRYFEKAGISVVVSSWRRLSIQSNPITAKVTGHYTNSVIAKNEALNGGYDDAILLNDRGEVCEGSGENIFMVRDGELATPPISSGTLDGITRSSIIKVARDMGFNVSERSIERSELYSAEELFFVGTAAEVTPIFEVDRRKVGGGTVGPITERMKSKFGLIVRGMDNKYIDWLEPVY